MKKQFKASEKGFTLIELLIVVAIIGILAAIAIPQFAAYRERGYIASMQADAKSLATAEEAYFADPDNGAYLEVATATDDPATVGLTEYGFKSISAGNKVAVAVAAGPPQTFTITVKSDKTAKTVVFSSADGSLTLN